ncbi:cytochrome c family protein [Altericroceibacterium spongiae]|uniref:Cytochrome c family protein n=1 Tax=Altericroceibacterium spongiae TaxID=2320269 RepID=A0A420EBV4_9SPHN|nr:cytochrome c family protein [Altericroceibacterium spongiae]RKF18177.1 cytochrome c family protein [Altericroceibacterium spongiae]
MTDRFNTIAGWILFAGIVAFGLSSISKRIFDADSPERPEQMGYAIEGVAEEGASEGPSLAMLLSEADPASGEKIFAKCVACHTIDQGGANGIGPNLWGTVGEPIGKGKAGFAFSSVLADHGGNWTFENLDEWLKSPRSFAPGTKMSFAGLGSGEDRADVIAYLNSMGSNMPFPEVEAPAEEDASDDGAAEGADQSEVENAEEAGADAVTEEAAEERETFEQ